MEFNDIIKNRWDIGQYLPRGVCEEVPETLVPTVMVSRGYAAEDAGPKARRSACEILA